MTKYRHTKPEFDTTRAKPNPPKTCPVSGKRMYTSERAANSTAAHLMADTGPGFPHKPGQKNEESLR
jgi:hypothetical protein